METIACKYCGSVDYKVERKANNDIATCNRCGRFIKNIPYSPPALYFGKYAGKPIMEFEGKDIEYLYWIRNHIEIWPKINQRTQNAILKKIGEL